MIEVMSPNEVVDTLDAAAAAVAAAMTTVDGASHNDLLYLYALCERYNELYKTEVIRPPDVPEYTRRTAAAQGLKLRATTSWSRRYR